MYRFTVVATILVLFLGACSSRYQAPVDELGDEPRFIDSGRVHRVNGGETLYVIAWMYDLDVNALARANGLQEPFPITVGQILSVDLRNQPSAGLIAGNTGANTANAAPAGNAVSRAVVTAPAVQRTPLATAPLSRETLPPTIDQPQSNTTAPALAGTTGGTLPGTQMPEPEAANPAPVILPLPTPSTAPPAPSPAPATVTVPPVIQSEPRPAPAPPAVAPPVDIANSAIKWDWPAGGTIIGRFSDGGMDNKGVDFDGNRGDPVMAAADGEVVYAGSGLLRYGDLVILKHNDSFLSAYAHNSFINVKEGDFVTRGQKIAELGSSGIDRNMLHFEIRLDGKPVDPFLYLPSR